MKAEARKRIRSLRDLRSDPTNLNKGTERGTGMLENPLRQYGAGRSIVADKNGVVVCGNPKKIPEDLGTVEVAELQTL